MKWELLVVLSLLAVLVVSGCTTGQVSNTPTCNEPYIIKGNDCCLDQDSDKICDDEQLHEKCEPELQCDDWGECSSDGLSKRDCIDVNKCGNDWSVTESQSCIPPCEADWGCTNWTQCTDGTQNRECIDSNVCGSDSRPSESKTCEIMEPSKPTAVLQVLSVNSRWYEYIEEGYIGSVRVFIQNTGKYNIEPIFDIQVTYGNIETYIDYGQDSYLILEPGEKKTDTIRIGADTIHGRGTYTINIDMKDEKTGELLFKGTKKVRLG